MHRRTKKPRLPDPGNRQRQAKTASAAAVRPQPAKASSGPNIDGNTAVAESLGPNDWFLAAALLALVFLVYQPAWQGGLIWDDDHHLTRPELQSLHGLWRIWFDLGATQQYYPLTHSLFWVEHKLWGDTLLGYHLLNIALHGLSALLVLRLARRLGLPGAFWAAAIFALHPLQVESVAWISELKNTLSTAFCLAALLAYLRFDRTRTMPWYLVGLALFALALLSKTVTAVLPAAILVLLWWQRGRIAWRRDVLPLLPWLMLGAAAGGLTVWVERKLMGAEGAAYDFGFLERLWIAGRVVWFYLAKLFWPVNLAFIYPRWPIHEAGIWQGLFPLSALGVLLALWLCRRHARASLAAALCYCAALFPALGFFNIYPFRYSFVADHFQYLAGLAIIVPVAAEIPWLVRRCGERRRAAELALGLLLVAVLATLSWRQSQMYADVETLYRTTIARNPVCWMAHNNLGHALIVRGRIDDAIPHFRKALELHPDYAEAHCNLGYVLAGRRQIEEAIAHYREALRIQPQFAEAQCNLGIALARCGKFDEAIPHYRKALEIQPGLSGAHYNFGIAAAKCGRFDEAIAHYQRALEIQPRFAEAHCNFGNALARCGRFDEAVAHYRQALEIQPGVDGARRNLAFALADRERIVRTLALKREALHSRPHDAALLNDIAWMLATNPDASVRNAAEAVELAQRALTSSGGNDPAILNTLAAAYAAAGRYSEAVRAAEQAVRTAGALGASALAEQIRARLELYRRGKPYRQPPGR